MQRIGGILIAFGFSVLIYEALRVGEVLDLLEIGGGMHPSD